MDRTNRPERRVAAKLPRRRLLGAATLALLAGCLGDSGDTTPEEGTGTTPTAVTPTDAGIPTDAPATSDRPTAEGNPRSETPDRTSAANPTTRRAETTETEPTGEIQTANRTASNTSRTTPAGTRTENEADTETSTEVEPSTTASTTRGASAGTNRARVGFTGDAMLGRSVNEYYVSRSPASVWGDMRRRLEALDAVFVNLECCISERGERWPDRTYYFRADPDWAIPALRAIGVEWASLANNHLLDFGPAALMDTVEHLSDASIANSGAGEDVAAAREPAHVSTGGVDLAFVSFTDNSPEYAAQPDRPGTAYVEMDAGNAETREIVRGALEEARASDPDHVVASLHWGPNWVVRPDEYYREFAHWLAEEGVDLIHGHSAHVFQGVEVYDETLILHDTGEFVDDYIVKEDLHNDRSFLFEVTFADGIRELRLVPIEIDLGVYRASEEAAAWARERMRELSSEFGTEFERDGAALVLALDGL